MNPLNKEYISEWQSYELSVSIPKYNTDINQDWHERLDLWPNGYIKLFENERDIIWNGRLWLIPIYKQWRAVTEAHFEMNYAIIIRTIFHPKNRIIIHYYYYYYQNQNWVCIRIEYEMCKSWCMSQVRFLWWTGFEPCVSVCDRLSWLIVWFHLCFCGNVFVFGYAGI